MSIMHRHVHLHVISSDLIGRGLKKKGHYNSFRPDLGFFVTLDEVLKLAKEGAVEVSFMRTRLGTTAFDRSL